MTRIIGFETYDLRFPTSKQHDGSDAMNPDPDYSAAYIILHTDQDGLAGHGMTFTIGRGNEISIAAIKALAPRAVGLELDWIKENAGRFWRHLTGDSQLRWIGPEKGAIHLGTAAIVNAVWDLWAKSEQKPVWRLVADMTPEQLIRVMEFRYITDCIRPEEALELLTDAARGKAARTEKLLAEGYPCYTTSAGWLGYDDNKLRRLIQESLDEGFRFLKFKVGGSLEDDRRRLQIARELAGPDCRLMIDANQVWEVSEAVEWVRQLAFAKPWFIEEPTSPDDVEGHRAIREGVAPVKVATGEMCQNRVLFKQFIMRDAIDIVQVDACRLGGLNEVLTVLLMAAKHKKPVWPHAGGVGLCEYVQHISMIDYLAFSGTKDDHAIEYVDHLHENFVDPCVIRNAAYMPPTAPGYSITMKPATLRDFQFHPAS
jgi:L-fuconate dehydratase